MKRTKMFFGAAAIALAAVGAISSASAHRLTPVYYQSAPNVCTRIDADFDCIPSTIQSCQTVIAGSPVQLKQTTNANKTLCSGNLEQQ